MALFRSFNEIVNSIIERLRLTQPNLDTKPGTVARDLFIDPQADQIEKLHNAILLVSEKQSPASATGTDLDRWASNFGIIRKTGSPANGVIVYTTNELSTDLPIPANTVVTAKNGFTYKTIGNFTMAVSEKNRYAAIASRLRKLLNLAGITDRYAIEIPVRATSNGRSGNIAPYQIINSDLTENLKITNLTAFSNGDNSETDSAFRSRVFSSFGGSSVGTSSGYRNAVLSVSGVLDALVVEPGNALMLRDGTETIEINDGSFRILNSGTGGKVDIYILGTALSENIESYIYIDKSGNGDPSDERNNYIPGVSFLDKTLTSEERRLLAFKNGQIPLQPINSIVSVSGNSSGLLTEKFTDSDGNVFGNYELVRDVNSDTGGSPFGYDYIRYISGTKSVTGEVIIKQELNGIDQLKFSDIDLLTKVYQDRQILQENSKVSSSDKNIIYLNHKPVVTVSRVLNSTTGEIYIIESQNSNSSGINEDGFIKISGKNLPTSSDILSVNYVWRQEFNKFTDFNGSSIPQIFKDEDVIDSIDWGAGNGIFSEECIIEQSSDGFEYQITTDYDISRILSVYIYSQVTSEVINLTNSDDELSPGLQLSSSEDAVDDIVSILTSSGIEVWNTNLADGSFNTRFIYLPSDAPVESGELLTVKYNKVEFYNIDNNDGSFSNNIITLASDDILTGEGVLDTVNDLFLTGDTVYVKYVAELDSIIPTVSLSLLPITGNSSTNSLLDNNLSVLEESNQPIFFNVIEGERESLTRFGPTRLNCNVTGTIKAGKIKISGTTLFNIESTIYPATNFDNLTISLKSEIMDYFDLSELPSNIGIARVNSIKVPDEDFEYDVVGYSLQTNDYDLGYSMLDTSLKKYEITLPETTENNGNSFSSSTPIIVNYIVYYNNDFEDLYFPTDQRIITEKVFGRIDRITVSSGFRSSVGSLVGSIQVTQANQPDAGTSYQSNYDFIAPKEGERITIKYNTNTLIADASRALENVRPITADVLVKEAYTIDIDVEGQILVNEDAQESETQIKENVINAIINLLNTSTLGSIIDYSDIINVATSVSGVDSLNISLFNETGKTGKKSFIKALDNQTVASGNISFEVVSRKNFRIT